MRVVVHLRRHRSDVPDGSLGAGREFSGRHLGRDLGGNKRRELQATDQHSSAPCVQPRSAAMDEAKLIDPQPGACIAPWRAGALHRKDTRDQTLCDNGKRPACKEHRHRRALGLVADQGRIVADQPAQHLALHPDGAADGQQVALQQMDAADLVLPRSAITSVSRSSPQVSRIGKTASIAAPRTSYLRAREDGCRNAC